MADSSSNLLSLVEAEIARRLSGGGYEEYQEGNERFRAMSLDSLRNFRRELMGEINDDASGGVSLFAPYGG